MKWAQIIATGIVVLGLGACSSGSGSSGGVGGNCLNLAGTWPISGDCPNISTCTFNQNGCSISADCSGQSLTGTATSSGFSLSAQGVSCNGSVSGTSASGSCTISGNQCQFTANCPAGSCTSGSGPMGAGGSTGEGGGTGQGRRTRARRRTARRWRGLLRRRLLHVLRQNRRVYLRHTAAVPVPVHAVPAHAGLHGVRVQLRLPAAADLRRVELRLGARLDVYRRTRSRPTRSVRTPPRST